MIARYLKYGNDCLLYQTRVSTTVYDTRLEAKTAFKQLCNELAQEYTKI